VSVHSPWWHRVTTGRALSQTRPDRPDKTSLSDSTTRSRLAPGLDVLGRFAPAVALVGLLVFAIAADLPLSSALRLLACAAADPGASGCPHLARGPATQGLLARGPGDGLRHRLGHRDGGPDPLPAPTECPGCRPGSRSGSSSCWAPCSLRSGCGPCCTRSRPRAQPQDLITLVHAQSDEPGSLGWKIKHDQRLNILLVGFGGPGHDGPYLTDSIMLLSIRPGSREAMMISLPRDLWVTIPALPRSGYLFGKLNSAYAIGHRSRRLPERARRLEDGHGRGRPCRRDRLPDHRPACRLLGGGRFQGVSRCRERARWGSRQRSHRAR